MADKPPLLFVARFGALHPANGPAKDAVKALGGLQCRVEMKSSGANQRRRGFYWIMLDVAADALTDKTDSPWDAESLHGTLKDKLRLGTPLKNHAGEEVGFKRASTSNKAMTEPDRARWTDRCARVLSHWIGCEIHELMDEARRRNGEPANDAA